MYSSAYFKKTYFKKKGYAPHQAAQLHRWIVKHGFTKSILQSDAETSLMQLVDTVSADLNLPTRVSSPYSHQSQGKVERFHQNLFDQLRTTRLQLSKDLKVKPHVLPPESLPWALQHSISVLNNYLVQLSGKTSHFENYRYNYRSKIVGFGEVVLGDVRNIPTQKLRLRNQRQKLRDIWLGRDLITNEPILALPLQYNEQPSTTTTGAHKCRQITRAPCEEQRDLNFLKDIYWPQLSDDIDCKTREHFNNLQRQNIATRDLQLQEPQDATSGRSTSSLRRHPQSCATSGTTSTADTPPAGLPQLPQALLHQPPMVLGLAGSSLELPCPERSGGEKVGE